MDIDGRIWRRGILSGWASIVGAIITTIAFFERGRRYEEQILIIEGIAVAT